MSERFTEWCPELEKALAEPFPIGLHTNKGSKGTFVSIHHYVSRLNDLVGVAGWSMPEPVTFHSGNKLGISVGVTILGVTKWNVGDEMEDHGEPDEDNKVRDFGSSSTNSFAQAFKRCCAYGFRLGLYLYDKDWTAKYLKGTQPRAAQPKPAPEPTAPKATKAQLDEIGILADNRDVPKEDAGRLSQELNGPITHARAEKILAWLRALPELQGA